MYIPTSTYRLQLHKDFNFTRVQEILGYLESLGISTIYASPLTTALRGSQHGYDVADPELINAEIGSMAQWNSITAWLKQRQMGWLQDIVPNHMAFSMENRWLYDVFTRGRHSDFFSFFDFILQEAGIGSDKIMVPFLGKSLDECITAREISLLFDDNGFQIAYADQVYPVSVFSYNWICALGNRFSQPLLPWAKKAESFAMLPYGKWNELRKDLMHEITESERSRNQLQENIDAINGDAGLLLKLLSFQHYRLCFWKESKRRMNYRRFFAINALICLRMEDPAVFNAYHSMLISLFRRGFIQGFRIDHIDGLAKPAEYVRSLRETLGDDAYIVDEKILQADEWPIREWPRAGTTGYDFLSFNNQLFFDATGRDKLVDYYRSQFDATSYADIVYEKKYQFLLSELGGELDNLLLLLNRLFADELAEKSFASLREPMACLMAAFPVYRIYPEQFPLSADDEKYIQTAFDLAQKKSPSLASEFAWLRTLFVTGHNESHRLSFIARWSQFTGPLAAKGTEDTAFYCYNPLISLNEVGDSPGRAKVDASSFHDLMQMRLLNQPHALNGSSTHDTKRGEDNRMRINMLTLIPEKWIDVSGEWEKTNAHLVQNAESRRMPARADEYLIYQALVGGYSDDEFTGRFQDYLRKALREANIETNHTDPDLAYEKACAEFVASILKPGSPFLGHFLPFHRQITEMANAFSVSQTVVKLMAPGIPDIYQGSELWDLSLVDPDNRRPVDYTTRMEWLQCLDNAEAAGTDALRKYLKQHEESGIKKLFVTAKLLRYRRAHPALFSEGSYHPVISSDQWIGYIRILGGEQVLVLAKLPCSHCREESFPMDFKGTAKDLFTGEGYALDGTIEPAEWLKDFPAGVFELRSS